MQVQSHFDHKFLFLKKIFLRTYSFRNVLTYNDVKIFYAICYNHLATVSEKMMKVQKIWHRKNTKQILKIKKGLIVGFHSTLTLFQSYLY